MIVSPTIVLILFLSSVAFTIILFLGVYVLKTNPGNAVNRLYFLITLLLLPWCLGEMFIITAPDKDTAFFWFRVLSSGWGFVDLMMLHFIILISGMDIFRGRKWLQIPYYLLGSFSFYGSVIAPKTITDFKLTSYGWNYLPHPPLWWLIATEGKMITISLLIIVILVIWNRRASHPLQKIQSRIMLGTIFISLTFYITVLYILHPFKTFEAPNIQHLVLVFWAVGMGFAIIRYKFMVFKPEEIAPEILKTMVDPLIVIDNNSRIKLVNDSTVDLLGYSKNYLIGLKITELFPREHLFQGDLVQKLRAKGPEENVEILYQGRDGAVIPILLSASVIYDRFKLPAGVVMVLKDISERKRAEVNLRFMATHDLLTGLPNRTILNDRLRQAIVRAKRYKHSVAVMVIDLDHFKNINDTLGHSAGDALLKSAAWRLKTSVRESDTVVRLGGDEFAIVLTDLSGVDSLKSVAERIMESFRSPFVVHGQELYVTPSIGISLYPSDGESVEELFRNADLSLYRAKEAGRNNYQIFTSEGDSSMEKRLQMEKELRSSLEKKEFEIYYQPVFELNNKNVLWVEAIIRWHRPKKGIIGTETFMPVAEQSGFSIPIGEWMLETACRDAGEWKNSGISDVPLAVSIPSKQFMQPNFVENVEKILNETGLEPRNLKIGINENMVTSNIDRSVDVINSLHRLGVQFVLSEFGTSYSSLVWFKLLPIKIIKISPLFIKNIQSDPYDIAVVKSIIMMANTLGIQVVAEGIENKEQLDFLKSLGEGTIPPIKCDGVQGYFLCEPMKLEDILRFFLRHSN